MSRTSEALSPCEKVISCQSSVMGARSSGLGSSSYCTFTSTSSCSSPCSSTSAAWPSIDCWNSRLSSADICCSTSALLRSSRITCSIWPPTFIRLVEGTSIFSIRARAWSRSWSSLNVSSMTSSDIVASSTASTLSPEIKRLTASSSESFCPADFDWSDEITEVFVMPFDT